jgi:hypothetical protein
MANIKKNTQITAKKKLDVINRGRGFVGNGDLVSRLLAIFSLATNLNIAASYRL